MKLLAAAVACAILAYSAQAAPAHSPAPPPAEADWRSPDPQNVLVIDTNKGRIIFELAPDIAPLAAARVRELARAGFYDGRAFFRVIDDFMDQTGDPTDTGKGGSSKPNLPPEFTFRRGGDLPFTTLESSEGVEQGFVGPMPVVSQPLELAALTADGKVKAYAGFCPGVGGMARAEAPDSANSQFFFMRGATPALDQKYTPFGRVIAGMDVVRAIKIGEPPAPPMDKMLTVRVLADLPTAGRPTVRVIDTAGPWFRAMAARVKIKKVVDYSICDLDLPNQIK